MYEKCISWYYPNPNCVKGCCIFCKTVRPWVSVNPSSRFYFDVDYLFHAQLNIYKLLDTSHLKVAASSKWPLVISCEHNFYRRQRNWPSSPGCCTSDKKNNHILNNLSTRHISINQLREEDSAHYVSSQRLLTDSCKKEFTFIQRGLILFNTGLRFAIGATVRLQSMLSLCASSCCMLWSSYRSSCQGTKAHARNRIFGPTTKSLQWTFLNQASFNFNSGYNTMPGQSVWMGAQFIP